MIKVDDMIGVCGKCDGKCVSMRYCNGSYYSRPAYQEGLRHPVIDVLQAEINTYRNIVEKIYNEFANNYGKLIDEIKYDRRAYLGPCTYNTNGKTMYFMYLITENLETALKQLNETFTESRYNMEFYDQDVLLIIESYKALSNIRTQIMRKMSTYIDNKCVDNTSRKLLNVLNKIHNA